MGWLGIPQAHRHIPLPHSSFLATTHFAHAAKYHLPSLPCLPYPACPILPALCSYLISPYPVSKIPTLASPISPP